MLDCETTVDGVVYETHLVVVLAQPLLSQLEFRNNW